MGYTHYLSRPKELDKDTWINFIEDVKKLKVNLPEYSKNAGGYYKIDKLELAGGDGTGQDYLGSDAICFNGSQKNDLWHETFHIRRKVILSDRKTPDENGRYHEFCKTARKPYDLYVCLVLIALKYHFNNEVEISSDGTMPDDWSHAIKLFQKTLDKEVPKMFLRDEEFN